MRYRALDVNGDYQFGQKAPKFLIDSSAAVAQAIDTRLRLATNEWFLDRNEGTPYDEQVLGTQTLYTRDPAIKSRITNTPGVKSIIAFASNVDQERRYTVAARVETVYGEALVASTL